MNWFTFRLNMLQLIISQSHNNSSEMLSKTLDNNCLMNKIALCIIPCKIYKYFLILELPLCKIRLSLLIYVSMWIRSRHPHKNTFILHMCSYSQPYYAFKFVTYIPVIYYIFKYVQRINKPFSSNKRISDG